MSTTIILNSTAFARRLPVQFRQIIEMFNDGMEGHVVSAGDEYKAHSSSFGGFAGWVDFVTGKHPHTQQDRYAKVFILDEAATAEVLLDPDDPVDIPERINRYEKRLFIVPKVTGQIVLRLMQMERDVLIISPEEHDGGVTATIAQVVAVDTRSFESEYSSREIVEYILTVKAAAL